MRISPSSTSTGRATRTTGRTGRGQLEQVRPANPKIPVSHVLLEGDPADEIARYAADAGIDVIVIGTRGRTGADRLAPGSVADRVMHWRGRVFGPRGETARRACPGPWHPIVAGSAARA